MRRDAIEGVIQWAVAPVAPLPAVSDTDAAAAFVHSLEYGPPVHRLAVRVLMCGGGRLVPRLQSGFTAPLAEALAALAQLAYYGEPSVLEALGCPSGQ
jgi:hypothetical protein